MKQFSLAFGCVVAAFALIATAAPAYSQSKHTSVSNDGSVAPPVEAEFNSGLGPTSASPSRGAGRITESALAAEGVFFDAESRAEFRRLAALPDAGTRSGATGEGPNGEVILGWDTRERLYTATYPARAKV